MMNEIKIRPDRLSKNFHKTFIPERRYIGALLKFAAGNGRGSIQEISLQTGIPTGKSSGKVAPIIDYCRGMGLITLPPGRSAIKEPLLSEFGRSVFLADLFLKEEMTQWLCHLNLCGKAIGAEIWHKVFWEGSIILGLEYSRIDLESFIKTATGSEAKRIVGPLFGMYNEESSFAKCGALTKQGDVYVRKEMPVRKDFVQYYEAFLLNAIEKKPSGGHATLDEIEEICGLSVLTGWSSKERDLVLEMIERKGSIEIDRHMKPWIIKPRTTAKNAWSLLFSGVI